MSAASERRRLQRISRTPLEVWAWSPVIVLRAALVITYALYIYFAAISFLAGVPAFSLTTFDGYTPVWASLMAVSATVAAIGSLTERWEHIEKWGSLAVSALMFAYVGVINILGFVSGDIGRQAVGAALTIGLVLPAVRFVYLAAQSGKQPHPGRR